LIADKSSLLSLCRLLFMKKLLDRLRAWIPKLPLQVWVLISGRLLSGIGSGFTLFYAPIFFVNEVGLTKTAVGLALGAGSISGVLGRILSGTWLDAPEWGRKRTLLFAAVVSAIASGVLAMANGFEILVLGNILMGLGIGLYWPATESVVADLTTGGQRHEAYAMARLGDSLGLQLGVIWGGLLISLTGEYRLLFIIDAASFVLFFGIIWMAITEPRRQQVSSKPPLQGWMSAFRDRTLMVYAAVNIMFTTYIAQIQTTLPLYLSDFVESEETGRGFTAGTIGALFTWHLALCILIQLPASRIFKRFRHPKVLAISGILWAVGFILIAITGTIATLPLVTATLALGILAVATVAYNPSASSLVAEMAPESLRGVYLSLNSQCWALGYFIGPILGGWVLDLPRPLSDGLWPGLVVSVGVAIWILQVLDRMLIQRKRLRESQV
jgi:MFS family permease